MRPSILFSLPMLGLLLAPLAVAAEEPKAIIEQAIKAHGAKETPAGAGITWKSKGQVFVQGLEIAFKSESLRAYPDRMRQDVEADVNGNPVKMAVGIGPKGGWMVVNDMSNDMPENQATSIKHEMHAMQCCQLTPLLKEGIKLESLGAGEVDGKKAQIVKVAAKDHQDVKLYFDQDSGMLVKCEYKTIDQNQGNEANQEMFFKEFKDFHGQKMFTKLLVKRDGEKYLDLEVSDYKPVDKVDDKKFEKP